MIEKLVFEMRVKAQGTTRPATSSLGSVHEAESSVGLSTALRMATRCMLNQQPQYHLGDVAVPELSGIVEEQLLNTKAVLLTMMFTPRLCDARPFRHQLSSSPNAQKTLNADDIYKLQCDNTIIDNAFNYDARHAASQLQYTATSI